MNQAKAKDRLIWSFWVAAGIAAIGGLLPLVFGGTSSRMAAAIVPFWIGAAALAACGFLHKQGRTISGVLYFVAGLALVYALLAMFAVPLQLAVLGSCDPSPAPCAAGLGRPLTVGENTGMGFAAGFGIAALFVGFFGLMVVFRRPVLQAFTPPPRMIPPVVAPAQTETRSEPATAEDVAPPAEATVANNGSAPAPPDEEPEELPAHEEEELPELPPPPESSPPTT